MVPSPEEYGRPCHLINDLASQTSSNFNSASRAPSLFFTTNTTTTTPALFLELFALVIAHAAPTYDPTTAHFLHHAHGHIASYKRAQHDFLPLSFVCRAFHALLKPFLFRILILTRGRFSAIPLLYALKRDDNWKYVKVVVYDGAPADMVWAAFAPGSRGDLMISGMESAIARAEKACVHLSQRADTLHVLGPYLSPGLASIDSEESPKLRTYIVPPTTRNIYWIHDSQVRTSEVGAVLRSASRTLETIDIYGWKSCFADELASALDDALDSDASNFGEGCKLTRIALFGGLVSYGSVLDLLSLTIDSSSNDSSLRQLVLDCVMDPGDMIALFTAEVLAPIWTGLTSLHISGQPMDEKRYTALSLLVLQTCPALSAFSYLAPTTDALFSLLPRSLRSLECSIRPGSVMHALTPEACAAYLRDERSSNPSNA